MAPGQQPEPPALTQVTTRDFRIALAGHLGSHTTTLILKRNTPIALLLPLHLNRWPSISDLKKARAQTLRRLRRVFQCLIHDHAS